MKRNEKGFGAVEVLLIIVVIALIGGAGWYVWQSKKDKDQKNESVKTSQQSKQTETPKNTDETTDWKVVESVGAAFTVKIPDGWELTNYPGNTLNGDKITYAEGKEAVITKGEAAYAGDQRKFNVTLSDKASAAPQWQSPNEYGKESVGDFTIGDLKGKRYSIEWTEDVTGVNKGDKVYQYVFDLSGGKQLQVVYMQAATDDDNHELVEKIIKTIEVK